MHIPKYVFQNGEYILVYEKQLSDMSFLQTDTISADLAIVLSEEQRVEIEMRFEYLKEMIELFCDYPTSPHLQKRLRFIVQCVRFIFSLSDAGFELMRGFLTRKRIKRLLPILKQHQIQK